MDYPNQNDLVGGKFADAVSVLKSAHVNNLTDEIINVIKGAELVPDSTQANQLVLSIKAIVAALLQSALATKLEWMKRSSTSTQYLNTSFVNVVFDTLVSDQTASDITYADGKFTAVVAGNYRLGGFITIQDNYRHRAQAHLQIYIDDTASGAIYTGAYIRNFRPSTPGASITTADSWTIALSAEPFVLTAGQTIDIRIKDAVTTTTLTPITRVDGANSMLWLERMG